MPIMDGYEFLGNLRRMPGGDAPKVVFCTTENDVAHIARALHAGANEYIMKPFDKDIVTAKFQEVGLISFSSLDPPAERPSPLSLDASAYIRKPESASEATAAETFRHDLIQKIRHLGAKVRRAVPATASPPLAPALDRSREPLPRAPLHPVAQPRLLRRAFST